MQGFEGIYYFVCFREKTFTKRKHCNSKDFYLVACGWSRIIKFCVNLYILEHLYIKALSCSSAVSSINSYTIKISILYTKTGHFAPACEFGAIRQGRNKLLPPMVHTYRGSCDICLGFCVFVVSVERDVFRHAYRIR